MDFKSELKNTEKQAKEVLNKKIKPENIDDEAVERNSEQIVNEAKRLHKEFPEPSIALAWTAVEAELLSAITRTSCSPDFPPNNSAIQNAIFLQEANYLSKDKLLLIKRMINLRNVAVHGRGGPISIDEANEFISLVKWLMRDIKSIVRK